MNATMARSEFGDRLRVIRQAAQLTQHQLAAAAGIHRQAIAKIELGESRPTWDTVVKLADALGCTPNDFLGTEED